MKREMRVPIGPIVLEDWAAGGAKLTISHLDRDEDTSVLLTAEESTQVSRWLSGETVACDKPPRPEVGEFANHLRGAMSAKYGRASAMAGALGIRPCTVSHWHSRGDVPGDAMARRVARYLGWDEAETVRMVQRDREAQKEKGLPIAVSDPA